MRTYKAFPYIAIALVYFSVAACGADTSVPSYQKPDLNPDDPGQDPIDNDQKKKIAEDKGGQWQLLPCEEIADPPETNDLGQLFFAGVGPHKFPMPDGFKFSLNFLGSFCETKAMGRDIVFLVDVAKNMRDQFNEGSDPTYTDGNDVEHCGRSDAIEAVLTAMEDDDNARFALATFDGGLYQTSTSFFNNADFRATYANADVLCTMGVSQTANYKAALAEAETFMAGGRDGASKEVLLISNGIVDTTADNGEDSAQRLAQIGSVGTLIIGASETYAKTKIASNKPDSDPFHTRVDNPSDLSEALTAMTESTLLGGSISYYAKDDQSLGAKINLDAVDDKDFEVKNVTVSSDTFPGGVVLDLQFFDSHGALYHKTGEMVWTE